MQFLRSQIAFQGLWPQHSILTLPLDYHARSPLPVLLFLRVPVIYAAVVIVQCALTAKM